MTSLSDYLKAHPERECRICHCPPALQKELTKIVAGGSNQWSKMARWLRDNHGLEVEHWQVRHHFIGRHHETKK